MAEVALGIDFRFVEMITPSDSPPGEWLSLQEASRRLKVHPTTLRGWADRGLLRVSRTPGGHRRFNQDDVHALLRDSGSRNLDLMVDAAVGRTRIESSDGRLESEAWYGRLDEEARQGYRQLGRDVMLMLRRHLEDPGATEPAAEARGLGERYAALAGQAGLTVAEAMRAFLLFKEMVAGGIHQLAGMPGQVADLDRRAELFVNEVLIAMVEAYTEEKR